MEQHKNTGKASQTQAAQAEPLVAALHITPVTHTHCWGSPPDLKHNTAQSMGLSVVLQE